MIYVNAQLEKDKVYSSHREMFPKLYYMDFSGKYSQIRHIHVELSGGDVYIQTDITDCNQLKRESDKILSDMLASAQKKLQEAQDIISTVSKVMEV